MIVEAAGKAIADAGIAKDEIDGVFVKIANAAPTILYGQKVSEALGLQPDIGCALDQGGAANIGLLTYAALAIEAGLIRNALICFGDTARTAAMRFITAADRGKAALRPKHVRSIRTKLQIKGRARNLAMFKLAIDSKLRGCNLAHERPLCAKSGPSRMVTR